MLGLHVPRPLVPERQHDIEGVEGHASVLASFRVDSEELEIAAERADPDVERVAPLRHVIQIGDPVREFDGVAIRKQMRPRAELDVLGSRERLSDQEIGRGAGFPGCGVVLSDPGLFEAEAVEQGEMIEVLAQTFRDPPLWRV